MWDEEDAYAAYCAYGTDFIRTAGVLARARPTTIYRASALFQRFQNSVKENVRSCYLPAANTKTCSPEQPQQDGKEEATDGTALEKYFVPDHVDVLMASGLRPLVDLTAPLDYCIEHLMDHDDIVYLCAACLLVAAKMEQKSLRLRSIVFLFVRLAQRRCRQPVISSRRPPDDRVADFRTCVLQAEEELLHQLGFQTFVETPYKYVLTFLSMLVGNRSTSASMGGGDEQYSQQPLSPEFLQWAAKAVAWVNDVPRCWALLSMPPEMLAVCAIRFAQPGSVMLPPHWEYDAFGVTAESIGKIERAYQQHITTSFIPASGNLERVRRFMPPLPHVTKQQYQEQLVAMERQNAAEAEAAATTTVDVVAQAAEATETEKLLTPPMTSSSLQSSSSSLSSSSISSLTPPPKRLVTPPPENEITKATVVPVPPILPFPDALNMVLGLPLPTPASAPPPLAAPVESIIDTTQFEDIGQIHKRRRAEEKQREKEREKARMERGSKRSRSGGRDERRRRSDSRSCSRDRRRHRSRDRKHRRTRSRDRGGERRGGGRYDGGRRGDDRRRR